jgi:hypothetical protein
VVSQFLFCADLSRTEISSLSSSSSPLYSISVCLFFVLFLTPGPYRREAVQGTYSRSFLVRGRNDDDEDEEEDEDGDDEDSEYKEKIENEREKEREKEGEVARKNVARDEAWLMRRGFSYRVIRLVMVADKRKDEEEV